MPTYEYECKKCGYRFELLQSIKADTTTDCPKCKKRAKRLIGAGAGIIFKGSGFYETDYKKKKPDNGGQKKETSSPCSSCPKNESCKE